VQDITCLPVTCIQIIASLLWALMIQEAVPEAQKLRDAADLMARRAPLCLLMQQFAAGEAQRKQG
jgi:hypothetical protein